MAHSQETKQKARSAYINDRLPLTVIEAKFKVSYSTLQAWKNAAKASGDDWDAAKSAATFSKGNDLAQQSVQDFETLFNSIYAEIMGDGLGALEKVSALATLSDAKIKTVKAAGMQDPDKARLGIALETLSALVEFIKLKHADKLADLVPILMPFGEDINKKWG